MRGYRTKRGKAWSGAVRAGLLGHCPGTRHDRSYRLAPGHVRRMATGPEEEDEEPEVLPPPPVDDGPRGLLLHFPGGER